MTKKRYEMTINGNLQQPTDALVAEYMSTSCLVGIQHDTVAHRTHVLLPNVLHKVQSPIGQNGLQLPGLHTTLP